jgi:hypothetical protein
MAAELELAVAKVAEVVVVLAHAAIAKLLEVAEELMAKGLVAKEQKMRVDYNNSSPYTLIL